MLSLRIKDWRVEFLKDERTENELAMIEAALIEIRSIAGRPFLPSMEEMHKIWLICDNFHNVPMEIMGRLHG